MYNFGELWSTNPRDYFSRNCNFLHCEKKSAYFNKYHRKYCTDLNLHKFCGSPTYKGRCYGKRLIMKIVLRLGRNVTIVVYSACRRSKMDRFEYRNFDFSTLISNYFCTLCRNFIRFSLDFKGIFDLGIQIRIPSKEVPVV